MSLFLVVSMCTSINAYEDTQEMIKNTLPIDSHNFITFGDDGILDNDNLAKYPNNGGSDNFNKLLGMSSSEYIFEVNVNDIFIYSNETGQLDFEYLDELGVDPYPSSEGMYLRTGEDGWVGHISFPGNDRKYNSTNNNIQITIHKDLSEEGRAQAFSHEAYGHGYLYLKNNGDKFSAEHQPNKMLEMNKALSSTINKAINETIKNMSK